MRFLNEKIMNAADASAASQTSLIANIGMCKNLSVQCIATGAPVGVAKVQVSNDTANPTNWTDLPSATISVSAAGVFLLPQIDICYNFIQCIYTKTSGTGAITLNIHAIGDI